MHILTKYKFWSIRMICRWTNRGDNNNTTRSRSISRVRASRRSILFCPTPRDNVGGSTKIIDVVHLWCNDVAYAWRSNNIAWSSTTNASSDVINATYNLFLNVLAYYERTIILMDEDIGENTPCNLDVKEAQDKGEGKGKGKGKVDTNEE